MSEAFALADHGLIPTLAARDALRARIARSHGALVYVLLNDRYRIAAVNLMLEDGEITVRMVLGSGVYVDARKGAD